MSTLPTTSFIKSRYLIEHYSALENSILELIDTHIKADMELTFIPDVVADLLNPELGWDFTLEQIHECLWTLVKKGIIELRPESGMNRLSKEELQRCPKQTWGGNLVYYSWTRLK